MLGIAIIGGGPAGLSAGIYAARSGVSCTLFEEAFIGGQAAKTLKIENYPGFPEGIDGYELGLNLGKQSERFGLNVENKTIVQLSLLENPKRIYFNDGSVCEAQCVIIASGATPRKLGISNEESLTGKGVSYCATCDGAFFRGMPVAVVGGGDTAISDALYLAKFAEKIYLIHRRDQFRAVEPLQKALKKYNNIVPVFNSVAEHLLVSNDMLSGVRVKNVLDHQETVLEVRGLFVAVGIVPRSELVKDQLKLDPDGSIVTDAHMRTSVEGVYAAGDVRNTPLRQVVTAVADGAVAATQAIEYISQHS